MSISPTVPRRASLAELPSYRPGRCNIGAQEIARRRRSGHLALMASALLAAVLLAAEASPVLRLLVALPVAIAAAGYVQASLRFCAAFGLVGMFNFGARGERHRVADAAARAHDRRRAFEITIASGAVGLLVGLGFALLPL